MKNPFNYLPDFLVTKWPEGEPKEVKQIRKTKPENIVDAKYEEIDNMSFEEFLNFPVSSWEELYALLEHTDVYEHENGWTSKHGIKAMIDAVRGIKGKASIEVLPEPLRPKIQKLLDAEKVNEKIETSR
ncbi:MAG: hypothetical protein MUC28_04220 [Planctomycetes bacterium]|jgi:hypothetical protein|nr:hypothetical protein [Planctomycetota bacterium]